MWFVANDRLGFAVKLIFAKARDVQSHPNDIESSFVFSGATLGPLEQFFGPKTDDRKALGQQLRKVRMGTARLDGGRGGSKGGDIFDPDFMFMQTRRVHSGMYATSSPNVRGWPSRKPT